MTADAERQQNLPTRKAAHIAWRGIRVRIWRSLLVTAGIVLPIAFLMYIVSSDAMAAHVREYAPRSMVQRLIAQGRISELDVATARIQTRWMIGLALLISFVGILNAMLMSVTERFREIGTMKCLGALDAFIIKLFLLESAYQGIAGTLLGIVLGLLLAGVEGMRLYGPAMWGLLPAAALARSVAYAFVAGMTLTVAGAVYPAMRAAHMQPVDAMRTEI